MDDKMLHLSFTRSYNVKFFIDQHKLIANHSIIHHHNLYTFYCHNRTIHQVL